MELDHIQWDCICVTATLASLDSEEMLDRDADQRRHIHLLEQQEWDRKTPVQRADIARRARTGPWRRWKGAAS